MKKFIGVAVLAVFATPPSLGVDCGWILWQEMRILSEDPGKQWDIMGSSEKFDNCQQLREQQIARSLESLAVLQKRELSVGGVDNFHRDAEGVIWVNAPIRAGLRAMEIRTLCLPSTFDPRGAK